MSCSKTGKNSKVPKNKSVKRIFWRKHTLICAVLPVLFAVLFSFPGECHAGKNKKDKGSKNENFTLTPTNHEEVLTRAKESIAITGTASTDDYWKGSHKLEFKPHPLLMPSTQTPMAQIPVPFIELGLPPTTPSPLSSSEGGGIAGEIDDLLVESASDSEEEKKGKTRKSRGGRKKSRDQRRMAHRTLWARQNAASSNITSINNNNPYLMRALQNNPYFLHNHHQIQHNQQPPVILTGEGGIMGSQSPLLIPPLNSRNDESFHGSATTWNINHPGNGIVAPNLIQSYPQPNAQVTSSSSSSSQETSQQVQQHHPQQQFPNSPGSPLLQYPFGYPPFYSHDHQFQQSVFPSQQHQQSQQQFPLQMPPLAAQGHHQIYSMAPDYIPQQSGSTPVVVSGNNGPMLMYMGPAGMSSQGGQIQSASGPIPLPVKPFNVNEVPGAGFPPYLQYNQITGPDFTGAHSQAAHHHQNHHQQNSGGSSGISNGKSNNPQYLRNNFLRMVMDKMAHVGRFLPIPFVTKYATPAQLAQAHQQQQEYSRNTHVSRRMKK